MHKKPGKSGLYFNPKGGLSPRFSGEDGIRTRDTRSGTPGFQAR